MRSRTRSRIAVDRSTGRIEAFASDQDLDGGGLANLSAAVAFVGATASLGIYDVPKTDVDVARPPLPRRHRRLDARLRRVPDDDGARGDDRRDGRGPPPRPGRLPQANLLKTGGKTMLGNVISGALRSAEVLDRLAAKPLWAARAAEKARRAASVAEQALWGRPRLREHRIRRGSDPAFALLEIDPAGRITLSSQAVEIGTGVATSLAVSVADKLGAAADEVKLGVLDGWDVARPGRAGRSVHHHARTPGRGGEGPTLGARHRAGHHRLDLGPCSHGGRRRGG